MRIKDYFSMFGTSLAAGFILSVIAHFIWSDTFNNTSNSFWTSWFLLSIFSVPVGYFSVKSNSSCPSCSKPFVMSKSGQTDIENFVKYKNESVTENGVTRKRDVPYNVRRFYQHMRCDKCSYEYKFESRTESRA